ncbi:MAG: 16S rRNA (uracil(1498)-N(3))-methyltransferase [Nitrospirae bacterium GWD2_57_8]|nr:MAG: 16S rRNA (uracil(1498)-N(3))-methyltransferase [Nitrospirae bacterium GWD2_57_8]
MNLILLTQYDFVSEDRARLSGRRCLHVTEVLRAEEGRELAVGLLNGRIGIGRVISRDNDSLDLHVRLDSDPPPPLPATVLLALPRPKVLRRVLFTLSTMGVKRIILLNALRVEKSYWQTPFLAPANIMHQLMLGLEQARDTVLPEVLLRQRFKPFVEDELPHLIAETLPLVAHPHAVDPCPLGVDRPVTLAIGPEGGFVEYELDRLLSCGFRSVAMGRRILTVESAVPALLGRLF